MTKLEKKGEYTKSCEKKTSRNFRKLTKKKSFSEHIAYQLYYRNPDSSLSKSYQNSIYCASQLYPNEERGTLSSHYCKNRWCPVCQSIRIAKLINGYASTLEEFKEPYFVTLTAPTVLGEDLESRIKEFRQRWSSIIRLKYWREQKPRGLRKAECTLRPFGRYHYHFHVIIDGRQNAEWLLEQWLSRTKNASSLAQDVRPVRRGEYIEIFKYFTKLLVKDKSTNKYAPMDFKRLGFLFETLSGSRVFQPFGGIKMISEEIEDVELEAQSTEFDYMRVWNWATDVGYVDETSGEILTGEYELPTWIAELTGKVGDKPKPEK